MSGPRILLDEHVGRIFERLLRERGYDAIQAKDQFGEHTNDAELVNYCADEGIALLTNNAKDFEALHRDHDHAGIFLYYDQELPDSDPEGLARTVDEVFNQYGTEGIESHIVDLDEWYDWLHE